MASGPSSSRIPAPSVLEIDRSKYPFSSSLFEPETMDGLRIQELLQNRFPWSERSELSYFEVMNGRGCMLTCKWETSWGGDVEMWHKLIELSWEIDLYEGLDVGDHEVAEFVYDTPRSPELRIFFVSKSVHSGNILLTRGAFVELLEKTGVPPAFIEVYGDGGALAGSPVYSNGDQVEVIAYQLLVGFPYRRRQLSSAVYFRYDFSTPRSTCLVFGDHIDQLQSRFQQLFPGRPGTCTTQSPHYPRDHFLVLSALAAGHVTLIKQKIFLLFDTVFKQQEEWGVNAHLWHSLRLSPAALPMRTKELHSCDESLAVYFYASDYYVRWVTFLQRQHRLVNEFRTKVMLDGAQGNEHSRSKTESMASQKVSASLDLSANQLDNVSSIVRLLSRHVQLSISVVSLSSLMSLTLIPITLLMAVRMSQAQSRISQFDSHTNISIAQDSRRIALDVKKDSVAMKTIAGLTMVFLPGTFTATFFSMVFFHVTDGPEQRLAVNEHWWLYIAVTVPLTVLVLAIWLGWMRWKRRGMPKDVVLEGLVDD